jgi:hypothetical protein
MNEERIEPGGGFLTEETRFAVAVGSAEGARHARFLIESLRSFGGRLSECPVWVLLLDRQGDPGGFAGLEGVRVVALEIEEGFPRYYFAGKVYACSRAEELAGEGVRSLVWLSPQCLIVNPPVLLDLGVSFDAAFRPVHIRNVGSPAGEPVDSFWKGVYRIVGIEDAPLTVESYVGRQKIRPYFNTHLFSIDPRKGVLREWWRLFKTMIADQEYQSRHCRDEEHRIFLHQALLSALLTQRLEWERIRVLPPEYSYPLHLHREVPPDRRPRALNGLISPVYEEAFRYPDTLNGLAVDEPLRSWLAEHAPGQSDA